MYYKLVRIVITILSIICCAFPDRKITQSFLDNTSPKLQLESIDESSTMPTAEVTPESDLKQPTVLLWTKADIDVLTKMLWGEARGIPSKMEKAAVIWCVLNRVDNSRWSNEITAVVTSRGQFIGYSPSHPIQAELMEIVIDVLSRWAAEKEGAVDSGRVLPAEYVFFSGDGKRNNFRTEHKGGKRWDWSMENPYEN